MKRKTVTSTLKLIIIILVIGGCSYKCISSGYKHYETQAESGLDIPENATDINIYSAITTWSCFDFKTDFESYKEWVKNFSRRKLTPISESNSSFMSYDKKQGKLLFRENIEHYKASWNFEDQGVYLIYVAEEGRAYYSAHSR